MNILKKNNNNNKSYKMLSNHYNNNKNKFNLKNLRKFALITAIYQVNNWLRNHKKQKFKKTLVGGKLT